MTGVLLPNLVLPFPTKFLARPAQSIGRFGLVYQHLPCLRSGFEPAEYMLYQSLPPRQGTRHRSGCGGGGSLVWQGGGSYVGLEWWCAIRSGRHHHGRYRKDLSEKIFSVGKHLSTHGGRFGRAMIKYPLYKKNNSRKNTLLYPGSRPCVLTVK